MHDIEKEIPFIKRFLKSGATSEFILGEIDSVTPERVVELANEYLPSSIDDPHVMLLRDPLKK